MLVYGILEDVIVSGHIGPLDNLRTAAGGHHHRAGGIQAVNKLRHGGGDSPALVRPFYPPLFVADTPKDNAGMVFVPLYHAPERFQLGRVHAHQARFLHHVHAQGVANVQESLGEGIVGGADGIDTQRLQLFDFPHPKGVRDGHTHTGMVLVQVHALQLDSFSVNEDALLRRSAYHARRHGFGLFLPYLQPYMPINAGPFVEPAFLHGSIGPDGEDILSPVVQVFRHRIFLRGVAALFSAQPEAVEPDVGIVKNAVKLHPDGFSGGIGREGEALAVPARGVLGIAPAHGLVAVALAGLRGEGKVRHPVVRKVHRLPGAVVKIHGVGALVVDGGRLGPVGEILRSAAEIGLLGSGVPQGETPALVQRYALGRRRQRQQQKEPYERKPFHCPKVSIFPS